MSQTLFGRYIFRIFFMKQTYQKFLHLLTELCQSGSPRRTIPLR